MLKARRTAAAIACGATAFCSVAFASCSAGAAGCDLEPQGEGRVTDVIDARSFRLDDGREIRLIGIEPSDTAAGRVALAAILVGREVRLRGADDAPDRYGRQPALVFVSGSEFPAQGELVKQGAALVSPDLANRDCAALLLATEAEARLGKRGIWADPAAIKNAESSGDILAGIGRFTVIERERCCRYGRQGQRPTSISGETGHGTSP
jgi:endonuclease YncB( thermonuclease family)